MMDISAARAFVEQWYLKKDHSFFASDTTIGHTTEEAEWGYIFELLPCDTSDNRRLFVLVNKTTGEHTICGPNNLMVATAELLRGSDKPSPPR
jgi:hypothetical protein